MKKLHNDGLLGSMDFESVDTCEPCLLGKMTRTLFTGLVERASDLLGIMGTPAYHPGFKKRKRRTNSQQMIATG
jgi:hypothetical protein